MLVKKYKYIGFCTYSGSHLLWPPVKVFCPQNGTAVLPIKGSTKPSPEPFRARKKTAKSHDRSSSSSKSSSSKSSSSSGQSVTARLGDVTEIAVRIENGRALTRTARYGGNMTHVTASAAGRAPLVGSRQCQELPILRALSSTSWRG